MDNFPFKEIDPKWQRIWEEKGEHHTDFDSPKPRLYCLVMYNYPSGDKLHIGHCWNYWAADIWARFKKMHGFNVFEPMGFDAFGLPAENYAIKMGIHPAVSTRENVTFIRKQLKRLGCMYDWAREVDSSQPEYYKWTQWVFLLLYKRGLAYQKDAPLNWCPDCMTVLANEQVLSDGTCERCGTLVVQRNMNQWFFKITDYADRLLEGLDRIQWPPNTAAIQKEWIGRSEGTIIAFGISGLDETLDVFTTRADTLFGVTYMVLAPEHPMVERLTMSGQKEEVQHYAEAAARATEIERTALDREKTGVFTGSYAINPLSGEEVPIWIADYVIATYGTGAVMAVPAHDQRDFEFARKYRLPIRVVIRPLEGTLFEEDMEEAFTDYGEMVNSMEFDGYPSNEGWRAVTDKLASLHRGGYTVNYHLRDWSISRQRYWGAPIPIIHCEKCGTVPVPEKDLPVLLPETGVDFRPKGQSPLASSQEFINTTCPNCDGPAKRDPDTMDTFVCSSWYQFRYLSARDPDRAFDTDIANRWMPVDQYIGGIEHARGHLLYARFVTKVFHDASLIIFDEPFQRLIHQGIITNKGEKMAKRRGNVVLPDEYMDKFGTDVIRTYTMFMGDFQQGGDWSDEGIAGIDRFVNRVWRWVMQFKEVPLSQQGTFSEIVNRFRHASVKAVTEDLERFHFNTAVSRMMEFTNELYHYTNETPRDRLDGTQIRDSIETLLKVMAPYCPHITEELWSQIGREYSIFHQTWPEYDESALETKTITMVVQVNGKVRDRLEIAAGLPQSEVEKIVLASEKVRTFTQGLTVRKVIVIPDRLTNIVAS
jgi:leucyl-tRNA synthetase